MVHIVGSWEVKKMGLRKGESSLTTIKSISCWGSMQSLQDGHILFIFNFLPALRRKSHCEFPFTDNELILTKGNYLLSSHPDIKRQNADSDMGFVALELMLLKHRDHQANPLTWAEPAWLGWRPKIYLCPWRSPPLSSSQLLSLFHIFIVCEDSSC